MLKNYFKGGMLLLAATSFVAANAEGTWRDVTNMYLKDATYVPGWQGVINATTDGVAETWNSAFRVYQVIPDLPAGEYTLTVNALYRCGNNDYARENMPGNSALHVAYAFINDTKTPVEGLFDKTADEYPNDKYTANIAFQNGRYVNTVKANHPGGDLVIGICNPGCYWDEWACYDNFKLTGPNGEVTLVNPNFDEGFDSKRSWNNVNFKSAEKTPDTQKDGASGGTYRKCGGSPYKYGQQVELPAGTYRFGMLTFHRCGSEVEADGSKYYHHKTGVESAPYGKMSRTPYDWFKANDYDAKQGDYSFPYIFMSKNATCPKDLNFEDDFGDLTDGVDVRTRVKDCWELNNGDINKMPHNNPMGPTKDGDWDAHLNYETKNKCNYFQDSGNEREAGAAFVAEPEKYYQYVEFTLTEPTKVWLGMGKNEDTSDGYWQPWADQKLEMLVAGGAQETGSGTEADPYLLYTAQDVKAMRSKADLTGKTPTYFKLMADVDMKEITDYIPVVGGTNNDAEYGTPVHFDGNYHVISNLTVVSTDAAPVYYGSLLGVLNGSCKNLGLVDVNLKTGLGVGAVGGYGAYGTAGTIENVYVTGKIVNTAAYAGGICGTNSANLTISNCYSQADVTGVNFAGGLVGRGRNEITIQNSYSAGTITAATACQIAATDKTSGVALKLENVATVATAANGVSNYGTMMTGACDTDLTKVATWAAFNEGKTFNAMPALNWQANAEGAGVDAIGADDNAPVEYYNLQGIRVENPTKGLYIKRQGNKATKVIL